MSRRLFYSVVPRKSEGIFPLENLPVAIFPTKSCPYGGKLHLIVVGSTLLFPGSTMESPNTIRAGARGLELTTRRSPPHSRTTNAPLFILSLSLFLATNQYEAIIRRTEERLMATCLSLRFGQRQKALFANHVASVTSYRKH